ncbi:class I SAM-dependent methyltransferase [Chenggangzhangella methanolivorans]|uniref:Class I SAM-dependent methyltransferase n=1 Tax=Chenggangzhangella methanolivorans TaxID=1437009 RepID=A0A9E6R9Q6_9HYPH|nr:class I SAM-dependent methyltransferase [Chenggangzhangella methanolivorans]QZO00385.1 class I SAM-dependent methyltransferase [Chenggangzhangella methanolivorans]
MPDSPHAGPLITEAYRQANAELHERTPNYGAYSARWADEVQRLVEEFSAADVLDYGCGKGKLAASLPEIAFVEYDPAVPGKDAPPPACDLVVCTDVLEHIEPELLDNVLADIARLARKAASQHLDARRRKDAAGRTQRPSHRRAAGLVAGAARAHFEIKAWRVEPERSWVNCVVVAAR